MHPPPIAIATLIATNSIIRVAIEQQMYVETNPIAANGTDCLDRISALQVLLEGAPALPEHKLSWHRAFEKLLDGTREGEMAICD